MRSDLTDITLVVDRSGSMQSISVGTKNSIRYLASNHLPSDANEELSRTEFGN